MAQQSRNTIKSYFQTGDIPTQQQYVHLIDSFVALTNDVNSGSITLTGSLNVSGNINHEGGTFSSPNATITSANLTDITVSGTGSFSKITVGTGATEVSEAAGAGTIELAIQGDVSASGVIYSNRNVTNQFDIGVIHSDRALLKILAGHSNNPFLSEGNPSLMSQRGLTVTLNGGTSATSGDEFTSGSFMIENHNDGQLMGFPGVGTTQIFKISHQGNISLVNHITASGNISCSGTVIADNFTSTGGDDQITFTDDLFIDGHITASGNISASGFIEGLSFDIANRNLADLPSTDKLQLGYDSSLDFIEYGKDSNTSHFFYGSAITASGNISASGTVIAEHLRSFDDAAIEDQLTAGRIHSVGRIQTDSHITASGNISSSGNITANVSTNGGFMLGSLNALSATPTNTLQLGNNTSWTLIQYGRTEVNQHIFKGHVTASGNIWVSGSTGESVRLEGLSGNISSSGTGSFNHLQIPFNKRFTGMKGSNPNDTVSLIRNVGITTTDFGDPLTTSTFVFGKNIYLDSTNGNIALRDDGSTKITFDIEGSDQIIKSEDNLILRADSSDITLDAQGNNIYFKDNAVQKIEFNTNSGLISSSGNIIAENLKIDGSQIDFTNLPTSAGGLPAGRLYRDGDNVKIAT